VITHNSYSFLFVELAIDEDDNHAEKQEILGIPRYIASGSHFFNESRYRFLIMPRYKADLHSITKSGRLSQKHFLIVAHQIIDVLKHLHEKHYVHSDIKAENIMIGSYDEKIDSNNQYFFNGFKKFSSSNKLSIQYSGANPVRNCRMKENDNDKSHHVVYNDMVRSHYLRPGRTVTYAVDENSRSSHTAESDSFNDSDEDEDFKLNSPKRKNRRTNKKRDRKNSKSPVKHNSSRMITHVCESNNKKPEISLNDGDDRVYIIDYGLATKFVDTNGEHRPFCMDQRRAHDGTLEFTSRDAHFGAHSRRSDLECFGYNLIYWSEGFLPWKDEKLKDQPEIVHRLKEIFMTDVKEMLKLIYGKDVPKYLGEFMHYVGQLEFDEEPDYLYLKRLFEKEFSKLGYTQSDMKLNLDEMQEQCEPVDKSLSEHDLMMSKITDLKTVTKLGFLVTTDNVDGTETIVKPNESKVLHLSCKASPKNLRSKEKVKGKRPKRQRKLTEKEIISEKMAKGKKLSIQEIATLDPEKIARDRVEKEYEKIDEKNYYQTPQRYKGNPTYAILEIENKLKCKQNGSLISTSTPNVNDIEPIKGYTKPMMDVLKKQQMIVEQQITPVSYQKKRSREGLRNVIKPTRKTITYQTEVIDKKEMKKTRKKQKRTLKTKPKSKAGAKRGPKPALQQKSIDKKDDVSRDSSSNYTGEVVVKKKRGRKPKVVMNEIEVPETEEDSVYYDIPGEGSNDGIIELSDSEIDFKPVEEMETNTVHKKLKTREASLADENSNQESIASSSRNRKLRGRYYNDADFEAYSDETSNSVISSISHDTRSTSVSTKPRRGRAIISYDSGILTRNKVKSRSTSRSAVVTENSEHSDEEEQDEGSEFEAEDSGEETEEEIEDHGMEFEQDLSEESEQMESDDDSIDIKYSPIKTRHARRKTNYFNNMKQIRGKILEIRTYS
jgi:serine/threonine protein kinase